MQQRFYGLTTTELRQMAFQVAGYKGVTHPFDHTKKMAGRHWLAGFLARNATLSIREPEATNITRAVGFNKAQVDFEIWRSVLESIGPIDGDIIWTSLLNISHHLPTMTIFEKNTIKSVETRNTHATFAWFTVDNQCRLAINNE